MAVNRQIARLAKILVDSEGIDFPTAEARLGALKLDIIVGDDATTPAAHAAILTAVSIGRRSFMGGVRVRGALDQPLNTALPIAGPTLAEAVRKVGAVEFGGHVSRVIHIGSVSPGTGWEIVAWIDGWRAGVARPGDLSSGDGSNPLAGIAAAALAVGAAFQAEREQDVDWESEISLWPTRDGEAAPGFREVFLPGALWLIGLGNLGQAYLWALGSLPYRVPDQVELVLVDRDRVSEENWSTSVLVQDEVYGKLKTKVGEAWCDAKGFRVRRVDRRLMASDRLEDVDPRVALSGVDSETARSEMAAIGFECIIDAGLGRQAEDFDRYRVTVFDANYPIDRHFDRAEEGQADARGQEKLVPHTEAYRELEADIGRCGAAEIAGASVAAPYVSALAAVVAIARAISLFSGCGCHRFEVAKARQIARRRLVDGTPVTLRASKHAGRPA